MKRSEVSEELVIEMYESGLSIEHIAKELKTNTVVVRQIVYIKEGE